MEEHNDPGVFAIDLATKGHGVDKGIINIKNPDTDFFFRILEVEKFQAKNPESLLWIEENGKIILLGSFILNKKHTILIHEKMGILCNIKDFWQFPGQYSGFSGSFTKPHPTETLWLKTTGKTDRKYDNEYQFNALDKTRCYKIARFLRAHDYKFSPELNDYLYLRCGIKFDLDLMDVDIVAFHDLKGQVFPAP